MNPLLLAVVWVALAVSAVIIVRHHLAYFRRTRSYRFGAFLETAGWIIVLLVALGALSGGLRDAGTRTVEIAAAIALLFIGIGSSVR